MAEMVEEVLQLFGKALFLCYIMDGMDTAGDFCKDSSGDHILANIPVGMDNIRFLLPKDVDQLTGNGEVGTALFSQIVDFYPIGFQVVCNGRMEIIQTDSGNFAA